MISQLDVFQFAVILSCIVRNLGLGCNECSPFAFIISKMVDKAFCYNEQNLHSKVYVTIVMTTVCNSCITHITIMYHLDVPIP